MNLDQPTARNELLLVAVAIAALVSPGVRRRASGSTGDRDTLKTVMGVVARTLVAAAVVLFGCSTEEVSSGARALWADDGFEIAVEVSRFRLKRSAWATEGTPTGGEVGTDIWLQGVNGENVRALISDEPNVGLVAFMRSAGHVVIAREGELVRVALDGAQTPITNVLDAEAIVPGPDGSTVAGIRVGSCRDVGVGGQSCTFEYRFFSIDGRALGSASEDFMVRELIDGADVIDRPAHMWTPDSGAVIAGNRWRTARIAVDGTSAPAEPPPCYGPMTSSTNISRDGRVVEARTLDLERYEVTIRPTDELGYPDRCFGP